MNQPTPFDQLQPGDYAQLPLTSVRWSRPLRITEVQAITDESSVIVHFEPHPDYDGPFFRYESRDVPIGAWVIRPAPRTEQPAVTSLALVFADELAEGDVILEPCKPGCTRDATTHDPERGHRFTVVRVRVEDQTVVAIVTDDDGDVQPWHNGTMAATRIERTQ